MQIPQLTISTRDIKGSNRCRILRMNTADIPGVIYGKGLDPVSIQALESDVRAVVEGGLQMVKVDAGRGERPAIIKEIQWDTYGERILHFDLRRVELTDLVEVPVQIVFRREEDAPGLKTGGRINKLRKIVRILCPAAGIPDSVELELGGLEVGDHLTLSDIVLPEGASLVDRASLTVVLCAVPKAAKVDEEPEAEGTDPTPTPGTDAPAT